jgi:hypothetical protein
MRHHHPNASDTKLGIMLLLMWSVVMLSGAALINFGMDMKRGRAVECSRLLHEVREGTKVPLHKDASVEIGACLLQFNQQIAGEDQ